MSEVKFRAKQRDLAHEQNPQIRAKQEYAFSYGTGTYDDGVNTWLILENSEKKSFSELKAIIVDPVTVGQYINRMDQRGHKLFTGDIVREACIKEHFNETRSLHKKIIVINYTHFSEGQEHMRLWKKIGNIHDNPELKEAD